MAASKPKINQILIAVIKQLIEKKASSKVTNRPLREIMIDANREWYTLEAHWRKFIDSVRKKKPHEICKEMTSVIAEMMMLASELYLGPLIYEKPLPEETFADLLRNKACPKCNHPGDVVNVLPQVDKPIWKLACNECGFSWFSNNQTKALSFIQARRSILDPEDIGSEVEVED